MTNQNNVPTAPGWYYRNTGRAICPVEPVLAWSLNGVLVYECAGSAISNPVEDDGLWRGPVPMQGEPHPDSVRLDALEAMANDAGGILLHDGSETGRRGLGLFTRGRRRRTLREAVDEAPR